MNAATRRMLAVAIGAAIGTATAPGDAVMLDAHGTGEVLIYPYYTVNHQQTLLSVINTTAQGKALKVRFREGHDGREVAGFNVYLAPFDTWVAAVFDTSGDGSGAAALASNDDSCTVPSFNATLLPGTGTGVLLFSNKNFSQGDYASPTGNDTGPSSLTRTREGFFEIIEMGEIVDQVAGSKQTLEAIKPVDGMPPNCAQLGNAWGGSGYWSANATTDLLPPAGGLYGAASIVDVARGTLYAYDAVAIDGFSDVVQHTGPGNATPNLGTAVTDSAHQIARAFVPVGQTLVQADYPAATRAVDAMSAVLMADTLYNEFDIQVALGAASDWLITFPTKQFYVDPAIVGTTPTSYLPPFVQVYGGGIGNVVQQKAGTSCVGYGVSAFDRATKQYLPLHTDSTRPPDNFLCQQVNVLPIGSVSGAGVVNLPSAALGSQLVPAYADLSTLAIDAGHVTLGFSAYPAGTTLPTLPLRASSNDRAFLGLPAVGFLAVNYVNANVTPGVLSNYSGTSLHRATTSCRNSTNPQMPCE